MTANTISRKLNLSVKTVYKRLKAKGIFEDNYNHEYTREQFLEICHDKYELIKRKKLYGTKQDLDIIHLYFTSKDNRIRVLAEKMNINISRVQYVIDKFLKEKEIILESKMNFLTD